jgi:hypothetical protein
MCTYLEGNDNFPSRIKDVKSWGGQTEVRGLNMSEAFRGRRRSGTYRRSPPGGIARRAVKPGTARGSERTAPAVQIVLLALLVVCHRRANGAPHVEQSRLRGPRETMYQAAH